MDQLRDGQRGRSQQSDQVHPKRLEGRWLEELHKYQPVEENHCNEGMSPFIPVINQDQQSFVLSDYMIRLSLSPFHRCLMTTPRVWTPSEIT